MFIPSILVQFRAPKGAPYDSTQGVPDYVFIGFWIFLIILVLRISWEFRDKLVPKALQFRDRIFPKATITPLQFQKQKKAIKK